MTPFLNWGVVIVRVNVHRGVGEKKMSGPGMAKRAASARLDSLYKQGLDIHVQSDGTDELGHILSDRALLSDAELFEQNMTGAVKQSTEITALQKGYNIIWVCNHARATQSGQPWR